jgi:hypothetical protein
VNQRKQHVMLQKTNAIQIATQKRTSIIIQMPAQKNPFMGFFCAGEISTVYFT